MLNDLLSGFARAVGFAIAFALVVTIAAAIFFGLVQVWELIL